MSDDSRFLSAVQWSRLARSRRDTKKRLFSSLCVILLDEGLIRHRRQDLSDSNNIDIYI